MTPAQSRLLRFILVGGLSTALYFLLLVGLRPHVASTALLAGLCYGLSMSFNFLAQGLWTFRSQRLTSRNLLRYGCVQGAALGVNAGAMGGLVDLAGASLIPAQIAVTTVVTGLVYILSARWVYR
ncbi:MAG: GtrA family protein [Alkalilacustris sp.]